MKYAAKAVTCSQGPVVAAGVANDGLVHVTVVTPHVRVVGLEEDRLEGQAGARADRLDLAVFEGHAEVLRAITAFWHHW